MLHRVVEGIKGNDGNDKKIKGTVVLMKKNVLDFNDFNASILDRVHELLGQKVSLQLISAVNADLTGDSAYDVTFDWDEEIGVPGAFIIRNFHHSEFYLKSLTLDHVPGHGRSSLCVQLLGLSRLKITKQIVFSSAINETPAPLIEYRKQELVNLRGDGKGKLEEWDRVYDYAYYNDLGDPDKGSKYARPILGGSTEYPYPRRGRTGRPPTKTDPESESRLALLMSLNIYVPRDERFGHLKMSDFLAYALKSEDKTAWRTDEEFAREMLAGVDPVIISRLQEFPPRSTLDPKLYGNQNSSITEDHIKNNLDGFTIEEAIENNRLFILDHHDALMPYVRQINATSTKIYATRTVLFLQKDGTLKPLAIELSLPHPNGDQFGAISKVYTPSEHGVEGSVWQLAKAYVAVNDSGYHQLISHWLNTHAAIEPFVIATNRQLSVLHPIHKLLHPHFRDTMNINAFARQILINAGGILEKTVFPGKYAMEMSAVVYKNWVFPEQALPADLIKRGVAMKDDNAPHGIRLLIQDYPYAVDGLKIWSAIETWVQDYCNFYYKNDEMVKEDLELQSWWKELREEGHGDKKHEPWWPKMQTRRELIDSCTIVIWVASALHAAVNFGQYPYAGYLPNRPTLSRRFMPEPGTPEYEELESSPDKAFLKTITAQLQTLLGVSLIEILSRHSVR
ncbi:hypothetical protein HYC85_010169 [Camellia sinensis]|uniref:Lipoxygenase n=1 Tax=Camellia sinensis TaxID=4442 RepID=A0A7J7HI45_CAMSI|nr:hypothetical protein HYC85_010169 [Camellia sinensis]